MRGIIVILTAFFIALVIGCDDGGTGPGGQDPPKPGYVWEVWERYHEDGYWYPPSISVRSYDSTTGGEEAVRWAHAPFFGSGFDAAYGDGRLWVAAGIYEQDVNGNRGRGSVIWEIGNDYFESPNVRGLTWDGEQLWGCNWGNFYTIDPDTHESEFMFNYGDDEYAFTGLAWDGEYLWAITPTTNEVIQIDPDTGTKVHSVPYPGRSRELIEYYYGLTWDGEALLLSDPTVDGSIYRISPKDGSVLWFLYTGEKPPYRSGGLAFEPA